jgi:hypothetical protein
MTLPRNRYAAFPVLKWYCNSGVVCLGTVIRPDHLIPEETAAAAKSVPWPQSDHLIPEETAAAAKSVPWLQSDHLIPEETAAAVKSVRQQRLDLQIPEETAAVVKSVPWLQSDHLIPEETAAMERWGLPKRRLRQKMRNLR